MPGGFEADNIPDNMPDNKPEKPESWLSRARAALNSGLGFADAALGGLPSSAAALVNTAVAPAWNRAFPGAQIGGFGAVHEAAERAREEGLRRYGNAYREALGATQVPATPGGALAAFVGLPAVRRLNRTGWGSEAELEKVRDAWEKGGGRTADSMAELWQRHGWAAPLRAFGQRGAPTTWLELPDLKLNAGARERLTAGGQAPGGYHGEFGSVATLLEPNADARRLLTAVPDLAGVDMAVRVGDKLTTNGGVKYGSGPGDFLTRIDHIGGRGRVLDDVEAITLGHEMRGHAIPAMEGTQKFNAKEILEADLGAIWRTPAQMKMQKYADELRAAGQRVPASDMDRQAEQAAVHAYYFARPHEKMARTAQVLHDAERKGMDVRQGAFAPGVADAYSDAAFVSPRLMESIAPGTPPGLIRGRDFRP